MLKHLYPLLLVLTLVLAGCDSAEEDFVVVPPAGNDIAFSLARQSVTDLTPAQRTAFVDAVKRMKTIPSQYDPDLNAYDYFVVLHNQAFSGGEGHGSNAHKNPNFLSWHREFLRRFEAELRRAGNDQNLTLPFWDWPRQGSFGSVFADDFLGGDGDPDQNHFVITGPFRAGEWQVLHLDDTDDEHDGDTDIDIQGGALQRNFGDPDGIYPTQEQVDSAIFTYRPYDSPPYNQQSDISTSFRNYVEGWWPAGPAMHNAIHVYVGGQMQTAASPNDPVFFLHHANIDRLWALYQATWGNESFPAQHLDEGLSYFEGVTARDTFDLYQHSAVRYGQ